MSILSLLTIFIAGIFLGTRRKPITLQSMVGLFLFLLMLNLISGIFLALTGVERPKIEFKNKRSV